MSITRPSSQTILSVVLPVGFFALTLVIERLMDFKCFTACEDGPVEDLQAIILFFAFGIGLSFWQKSRTMMPAWARVFFMLGILGALYAGLEEISYGQRIFGWITPDSWDLVNDQGETNLHNTSAWLDQKPRLILEIGVLLGGIVVPLLRRFKPSALPARWNMIYPSDAVFPTALFAIGVHIYHMVCEHTNPAWFLIERGSEFQETYLFWFMLLYFVFKKREFRV